MKRIVGIFSVLIVSLLAGFSSEAVFAQAQTDWAARLETVADTSLRQTLSRSISIGLIKTEQEFESAHSIGVSRLINGNPNSSQPEFSRVQGGLAAEIEKLVEPIQKLDRDALKSVIMNNNRAGKLFNTISGAIPESYDNTFNLAIKFNPNVGTNDAPQLDKEINAYLKTIENDPVIQYALKTTNTDINQMKRNWFGAGVAFEHVIGGEKKGGEISGYHWWYKFYRDELEGRAKYGKTLEGFGNPRVFTGQFSWDPDGNGPMSPASKKKGGFAVGNSAQAILALGHIAMETARKMGNIPGAFTFKASINGEMFTWQVFTLAGSLRSMYPMVSKDATDVSNKYYELEQEALPGMNGVTLH